jgi:hypothetical protein
MTLDRWRGQLGVLGWLVRKWDVWQLKRFRTEAATARTEV